MPDALLLIAQVGFVGVGAWLTHVDITEHRLPNRILLPAALGLLVLCGVSAAADASPAPIVRGTTGALLLGGTYLLLRAASRGALGGGDVKLAAPVGLILAWDGWVAFVAGGLLAFVVGGVWAIGILASGRGTRDTHLPFGPSMILGAILGLAVT